jgi:predicted Rossmann-fold nucleotide-binding protein
MVLLAFGAVCGLTGDRSADTWIQRPLTPCPISVAPLRSRRRSFQFHYFAMRANALAIFPSSFGTMDELFELLTLQQTRKAASGPVVMFGEAYWRRIVNFDALAEEGMISPADLQLFEFAESAEEGWASLARRGLGAHRAEWGCPDQC